LARFDGNLKAAGEAELDIDELLSALSSRSAAGANARQDAIACFLSGAEGWREARGKLKGTFARLPQGSWLTDGKE
jgi:hypothetical protein